MTAPPPLALTVDAVVPVDPAALYDLVSDVPRMGEWSPETVSARWLDGATRAAPCVRFVGVDVVGRLRWSTRPTIEVAERGTRLTFRVPGASGPLWTYELEALPGGTRVTESMVQAVPSPAVLRWLLARSGVADRGEHLRQGMLTTLRRLAAAAVPSPR